MKLFSSSKRKLTRRLALGCFTLSGIVYLIGTLVDYEGLNYQSGHYFNTIGADPTYFLRFHVAPWGECIFFLGLLLLLISMDVINTTLRWAKQVCTFGALILFLDVTYKTKLSFSEYDFFAEFNQYPFSGLPFDLRIHQLKSINDKTGKFSTADPWFTLKGLYPQLLGAPLLITAAPVPVQRPSMVKAVTEAKTPQEPTSLLQEFNCFPANEKDITVVSDGVKLISSTEEVGEKTDLHLLGKISGGPCSGGEIFRKTTAYGPVTKTYLQTFDNVLVKDNQSLSEMCEDREQNYYIELTDKYVLLMKERDNVSEGQIANFIFKSVDYKKLKLATYLKDFSQVLPPDTIMVASDLSLKFNCQNPSFDGFGSILKTIPSGFLSTPVFRLPERGVIVKFNNLFFESALYSSRDLTLEVDDYVFTGIVELNENDLVPLQGNKLQLYTWKDENHPLLKKAYPFFQAFLKDHDRKENYQEFVKTHPYLFWKDPLSRWQRFTKVYEEHLVQVN